MGEIVRLRPEQEQPSVFSAEAEQRVLGAILLDNSNVSIAATAGGPDLFYDPVHAALYQRIAHLERDGILASPVTLQEWAAHHDGMKEIGGPRYLARISGSAASRFEFKDYCHHLAELRRRRLVIEATDAATREVMTGEHEAAQVAGRLEAALSVIEPGQGRGLVSMTSAVTKAAQEAWAAQQGEQSNRVPSGINALDRIVGGFYPGDLVLLGGRPSMGKSAVAVNLALNAARRGEGVAFCSLEMQPEAIALRAVSEAMAARGKAVSYLDLRSGNWTDMHRDAFADAMKEIAELPIFMMPRDYADVGALMAGAKQARARLGGNLRLVVVDYVQLMRASRAASRYETITEISTSLKRLAGTLDVPVVALSQLSRAVETREDKRPMMSDLRESGQLEQDADTVLFCYRDEYYLEREKPQDAEEFDAHERALNHARNKLEIIVAKQRQGGIGTAHVMCNVAFNRIWEAGA
ncbi:replicative DNA helicase [Salipiger thiooxidans]|uniref:replicative DNA helicase n=1 Tax=Salipiger thiooxidans TaxID=282683 RepID=UPI001CD7310B|nr:DnaB-like helicase C-terminal domain-containing protein [Salipiger thiooxidans]MCA0846098.1 AAA family ATPase [Salipiger thiooxidans]